MNYSVLLADFHVNWDGETLNTCLCCCSKRILSPFLCDAWKKKMMAWAALKTGREVSQSSIFKCLALATTILYVTMVG